MESISWMLQQSRRLKFKITLEDFRTSMLNKMPQFEQVGARRLNQTRGSPEVPPRVFFEVYSGASHVVPPKVSSGVPFEFSPEKLQFLMPKGDAQQVDVSPCRASKWLMHQIGYLHNPNKICIILHFLQQRDVLWQATVCTWQADEQEIRIAIIIDQILLIKRYF